MAMSYSRILVPVAPGHGDEARRAMEVARSLLAPDGTITVLTVLEDLPRYLTAEVALMGPVLEGNRAVSKAVVDDFSAEGVEVITRDGHPTRTILDEAEDGGYDCIVIASAQPGWPRMFLGSTASGVVRHAHCSVHVLRDPEAS